ncbi:MAG: hypothetical protein KAS32_06985 [Candidatus Peribacteraceae bacterium]|nr:hypothetical protein [Candidatus Peribacteraceae bacterium]
MPPTTKEGRAKANKNLRPRRKGDPPLNLTGGVKQLRTFLQQALDGELLLEDKFSKELVKKKAMFHLITTLFHKAIVQGDVRAIKELLDRAFGPVTTEARIEIDDMSKMDDELIKTVQERIDELTGGKDG